ncbi:MAG TPA: hypothetical protein VFQ44_27985 [Streptosporangiaceae bacterium]|nr:hypothetical protein [Streptosporangiaceae bacterium]
MTGQRILHQIEFRWQPDKDFSAIASSFDGQELNRAWSARITGPGRPATPDPRSGVPERSVAYLNFPAGMAALVWRHYQRDARPLYRQAARQPLVARALIGESSWLTAGLAMAMCHVDYVGRLSPPAGQVEPDARLEPIDSSGLVDALQPQARILDSLARHEQGLMSLVATALRHPGSPLSIVLPGAELAGPPESSAAVPLLWGLWRTTAPLLVPGGLTSPRGWSFSSYEPPLGNSRTGGLPAIVFRSQEQERRDLPPLSYRAEVTVRPRDPVRDDDHAGLVAQALTAAYRAVPAGKIWRHLKRTAVRWPELSDRLKAIERDFRVR